MSSDEECDDGNTADGDGCSASCTSEYCGDGYLDFNGQDDIFGTTDDELCDDGNTISGDGCGSTCVPENKCGDGYIDTDGLDDIL